MKVTAVICEYNPFHKGHKLQMDMIKSRDRRVVCIMSGGFVQRGGPALFGKYERAKAAVLCGADLVIELPFPYSCSAAEFFSFGAVSLVDSLGCVDELCFGSETGDLAFLRSCAEKSSDSEFESFLVEKRREKNYKDVPYAALRENLYEEFFGEKFAVSPNDILGVEYIKALMKLESLVEPITYKREKGWSATRARRSITEENSYDGLPDEVFGLFSEADRYSLENAERAILSFYRGADVEKLKKHEGMTNGLASKLKKSADISTSYNEFIDNLSSKTYTNARVRRAIISGMTGVTPEMLRNKIEFSEVLAVGEGGRELIRRIKKEGKVDLLTKPSHYKKLEGIARRQAEIAFGSDALLGLMCDKIKETDYFIKQKPYILKGEK